MLIKCLHSVCILKRYQHFNCKNLFADNLSTDRRGCRDILYEYEINFYSVFGVSHKRLILMSRAGESERFGDVHI